jgi:cytochrome c oxidase assembly factor CtaG
MSTDDKPKLDKILWYSIIILVLLVTTIIINFVKGSPTLSNLINWVILITWAGILVASAVIGPRVIEKADFVPLIFGITFIASSGTILGFSVERIVDIIDEMITYPSPSFLGLHIVMITLFAVCVALSILIFLRGIDLIKYYLRKKP